MAGTPWTGHVPGSILGLTSLVPECRGRASARGWLCLQALRAPGGADASRATDPSVGRESGSGSPSPRAFRGESSVLLKPGTHVGLDG